MFGSSIAAGKVISRVFVKPILVIGYAKIQVNRIPHRRVELVFHFFNRLLSQLWEFQAIVRTQIRNINTHASSHSYHCNAITFGKRLSGKNLGEIFQFHKIISHDHTSLFDCRFDNSGVAGNTAHSHSHRTCFQLNILC